MQKVREKISECPPSVCELFKQANSLPKDFPDSLAVDLMTEYFLVNNGEVSEEERFFEIVDMLPKEFFDNYPQLLAILEGKTINVTSDTKSLPQQHSQWKVLWVKSPGEKNWFYPLTLLKSTISWASSARKGLYKAIEFNSETSSQFTTEEKQSNGGWDYLRQKRLDDNIHFYEVTVTDGVIRANYTFPFNILINESIDTRRIKNCRNCAKFFWVKRLNKNVENELCESCSNKSRQKRFIEKNKEEIKRDRRKNYYYKNSIPYCEKCVRPNTKCSCYLKERSKK